MRLVFVLALVLMHLGTVAAFGLPSYDPSDSLYAELTSWENRGVIHVLPLMRPYSVDVLTSLLREVLDKGGTEDVRAARSFLSELENGYLSPTTSTTNQWRDSTYYGMHDVGIAGVSLLQGLVGVSGQLRFWLVDGSGAAVVPPGERVSVDLAEDAVMSPLSILGRTMFFRVDSASSASVGNGTVSFQVGVSRASFGPFFDNGVVIGPQAGETGNLLFTWRDPGFEFSEGFFSLIQRLPGGGLQSGKFLLIHDLRIFPWEWLQVGFLETVIWTQRFEPLYLVPLAYLFYQQSLTGYADNSFLGVTGSLRLPGGWKVNSLLYVDDLWKWAGQAGVSWSPGMPLLKDLALDYTFVLPYTYTHFSGVGGSIDYTDWGANFGPALEPNSDRVDFLARLAPLEGLTVEVRGRFIRHGNASEGIPDMPVAADGTITDTGYNTFGSPTFVTSLSQLFSGASLRFLTQDVIDMSLQTGVGVSYALRGEWGRIDVSARYLFETRFNENLVPGALAFHNYVSLGLQYRL